MSCARQEAATEIGNLVSRILAIAPTAGLFVGIKIERAHGPSRPDPELKRAIAADSHLSLRACAAKHGVGVSVVRTLRAKRGALPEPPEAGTLRP